MKKSDIILKIRKARFAHIQWVQKAKSLVNGFEINEKDIPLTPDTCEFGCWFYTDGQILLTIFNEETVNELELLHNQLHEEYLTIFKIYFDTSDFGLIAKLLHLRKRVTSEEQEKALKHFRSLKQTSEKLIKKLNVMETQINMADPTMLERYA